LQKSGARGVFKCSKTFLKTAAEAEKIHAAGHLNALDMIGSTTENLKAAIEGETYEYTQMYPPMLQKATEEGHKAKTMFGFAVKAEEVHANLYKKALEAVQAGKDFGCYKYLPLSCMRLHRI